MVHFTYMFLLFLLGHKLFRPLSSKLKEEGPIDLFRPIFNFVDKTLNGGASFKDFIQLIGFEESVAESAKTYVQSFTKKSFEDFFTDISGGPSEFYDVLKNYAGSATVGSTGLFQDANKEDIIEIMDNNADFFAAANLDAGSIKNALLYIVDNQNTITISGAINKLGYDIQPIFDIYNKMLETLKPKSGYTTPQFFKDYIIQPQSIVDEIVNNAGSIVVDGKFNYQYIENLIFAIVKLISNSLQIVFSFVFKELGVILGQLTAVFDFNAKSLNARINNVISAFDIIIARNPDEDLKEIRQRIIDFRDTGIDLSQLLPEEMMDFMKLGQQITNPTKPLIKAFADANPNSDFGVVVNLLLKILDVLKSGEGKMADIKKSIDALPDRKILDIELKSNCTKIYNYLFTDLPKSILEDPMVDWLGKIFDKEEASDFLNYLLELIWGISDNYEEKLTKIFELAESSLVNLFKKVDEWTGGTKDIIPMASEILSYFEMGTPENCTFAVQTSIKALGKVSYILSKLSSNSAFPFTIIFDTISGRAEKYSKLFNQNQIFIKDIANTIYPSLGILIDVANKVASNVKNDMKLKDFLALVPKTFLDVIETIKKLDQVQSEGYTYNNVTLPMIVNCITISNKLKVGGNSFNDLVPLKLAFDAATKIKETPADQLTTKVVCTALNQDPDLFTLKVSSFEGKITSDQTSVASLTKTFTNFDVTKSFTAISNLAGKIANKEVITTNDVETAVKDVVEDAQQHIPKDPTPKGTLGTGPIIGIVIACVVVVAVIVAVVIIIKKRNANDSDGAQKP